MCANLKHDCSMPVEPLDPLAGTWLLAVHVDGERKDYRVTFTVDGSELSAAVENWHLHGHRTGSRVHFLLQAQNGSGIGELNGELRDGALFGKFQTRFSPDGSWYGWRPKLELPREHVFVPSQCYRYFSHTFPPALKLVPGDKVSTKCLDSSGRDENGEYKSLGGNPLTGPFLVENAVPGDSLVVKLMRLEPNRNWAESGCAIVEHILSSPDGTPGNDQRQLERWNLDMTQMHAYLAEPANGAQVPFPIRPMLGCIGVAPPDNQAVPSYICGDFGGNLDYRHITSGTTLYLPVFHYGAYLFLGDGHALQGDGEVTGNALEVSTDVEFSIDLLHETNLPGPYAECADYIMAFGFGTSLDQASRSAIDRLHKVLRNRFQISTKMAALLLGCHLELDIPSLVGVYSSVVARMPRTILPKSAS
jgi:amidase